MVQKYILKNHISRTQFLTDGVDDAPDVSITRLIRVPIEPDADHFGCTGQGPAGVNCTTAIGRLQNIIAKTHNKKDI